MVGVFISYRSGEDGFAAQLIDQRMCAEFGDENVFRDRRSVRPGTDFPPELARRLRLSTVQLVLIGPNWLMLADATGNRRIDNPDDYVRMEVRQALDRMLVIPVLINQARLPRAEELPSDLQALTTRQYMEMRGTDSGGDLQHLVDEVARHVPRLQATVATASGGTRMYNIDNRGASTVGPQIYGSKVRDVVTNYGAPPRDHWMDGLNLFRQRSYPEAAACLRKALAEPGAPPEVHFYLALCMLGGRRPRDHAIVSEIVGHLELAKSLEQARLLWLVVDEDHHPRRGQPQVVAPLVQALVDRLNAAQALEIVSQFSAYTSPTWRALAYRAKQTEEYS